MTMFDDVPLYSCVAADTAAETAPTAHHALSASQAGSVAALRNALITAASLPRDEVLTRQRLLGLCVSPAFAAAALHDGAPALTLAATAARLHGNLTFGLREGAEESEAFAWDMETNVRAVRLFRNRQSMRRTEEERCLTAALLDVLPAPLMAEALERCRAALRASDGTPKSLRSEAPAAPTAAFPDESPLPDSPRTVTDDTTPVPDTHSAALFGKTTEGAATKQPAGAGPEPRPESTGKRAGKKRRSTSDTAKEAAAPAPLHPADTTPADEEARTACAGETASAADGNERNKTVLRRRKSAGAGRRTKPEQSTKNGVLPETPECPTSACESEGKDSASVTPETVETPAAVPAPCASAPATAAESAENSDTLSAEPKESTSETPGEAAAGADFRPADDENHPQQDSCRTPSEDSGLPSAGQTDRAEPHILRYRPELILCPERARETDTLECHTCPRHDDCPAYA